MSSNLKSCLIDPHLWPDECPSILVEKAEPIYPKRIGRNDELGWFLAEILDQEIHIIWSEKKDGWHKLYKKFAGETDLTKDIRILFHFNYWDGPISGLCLYKDEKCWFHMIEPEEYRAPRVFGVWQLAEQDLAYENKRHKDFQEYVGTHCDYDENGNRTIEGNVKPQELHCRYYNKYKNQIRDYTKNKQLGIFYR